MSKANTYENQVLDLLFNSTLASHLGTLGTTGNTNVFISLHTSDPGETGTQTSGECSFGSYARVAVVRTTSGWAAASGGSTSNAATISFPECSSGSETVTHVGIGTSTSGTGTLLYKGALTASRAVSTGITLQFAIGALQVSED